MNNAVLLLGVATAAFGGASAYLFFEVLAERERSAELQVRVFELERRSPAAEAEPAGPPPFMGAPAPGAATSSAPTTERPPDSQVAALPAPEPQVALRERALRMHAQSRKLFEDPEYRAARRTQHKLGLRQMYPDLGPALGLRPEEVDKFLELLAEHQLQAMEVPPPFVAANGSPDPQILAEWQRRNEELQQRRDREIADLLGEDGLAEWKEYQETLGARIQVKQFREVLASAGMPLSPQQAEPLVDAFAQEQRRHIADLQKEFQRLQHGGPVSAPDQAALAERNLELTERFHQRLREAAAPHLSNEQLGQLDQMLDQQLEMTRAHVKMARAQAEAEARGEVPAVDFAPGVPVLPGMSSVPVLPGFSAAPMRPGFRAVPVPN